MFMCLDWVPEISVSDEKWSSVFYFNTQLELKSLADEIGIME